MPCRRSATLFAGLRAYWVNDRGAVAWTIWRHMPAREADALALDVGAGVVEQPERLGVAAELDADLLEDRVGVVLDEREALLVEDLERGERAGQERHPLDVVAERARPAGRPGRRCAGGASSSVIGASSAAPRPRRRRRRRRSAPAPPLGAAADRACRQLAPRDRCGYAAPSGGGTPSPRRSAPGTAAPPRSRSSRRAARRSSISRPRRAATAARSARPVPAALPADVTRGEVAVGDQPEDHRVERVDVAAERAGQPDLVDRARPRRGPSAAGRPRTAPPSRAGSRGRRSG